MPPSPFPNHSTHLGFISNQTPARMPISLWRGTGFYGRRPINGMGSLPQCAANGAAGAAPDSSCVTGGAHAPSLLQSGTPLPLSAVISVRPDATGDHRCAHRFEAPGTFRLTSFSIKKRLHRTLMFIYGLTNSLILPSSTIHDSRDIFLRHFTFTVYGSDIYAAR